MLWKPTYIYHKHPKVNPNLDPKNLEMQDRRRSQQIWPTMCIYIILHYMINFTLYYLHHIDRYRWI